MTSDVVRWTGFSGSRLFRENVFKSILYEIVVLFLVINCNVSTVKCASFASDLSSDDGWDVNHNGGMTYDGHFTPTWAVHIPGGHRVADTVAAEHGFVNFGEIFDDHYHFYHNKVQKRSIDPSDHHQGRLDGDHRVLRAVQQRVKSRQKRDLIRIRQSRTFSVQLNDPKWPHMWYLNRGNGLDMNVIPAWKDGITGKGVVVTILDDGLESDHPDLEANYDPYASYDVNSHDEDPMPHYDISDSNRHGTRCAGEVAATANNSLCAVGIAYGASVGGVRMLDGDVTDAVEARSLSLNPQHIDIYSASWGPDDDGKTVDGPGELATRAFIEGVKYGRGGKGSIFVWASGNGGREHDNCNCDGYTNSIWTLSISSATEEGAVPWYSEMCSSTLATTYSSGGQGEKQIVTTDLHHSCTTSHTGTSASAPLAAGIVALVLEANRNLTWRDLQHIVVRTAKPGNLNDPTWGRNGVGRRVSHSFGYGLMDAAGMVKLARTWKTVPEQQLCEINAPPLDRVIPPKGQIILTLMVEHCMGVNYLEHVQAKITLTSQRRGDIQIYLTSPAGTRVTLLTSRIHDVSRAGFTLWPFMSVHTWGEAPHGNWQLEIRNEGRYMGHAALKGWSLIFYGTKSPVDKNDPVSIRPTGQPPASSVNIYPPMKGGKSNNRKQPNGGGSNASAMNARKNGKGSKNAAKGGGKNNSRTTTIRPSFTTLFGRRKETKRPDFGGFTVSGRTTVRPKPQLQTGNIILKKGEKLHGSLSTIHEKVAVKAPKQIKENHFANTSLIELIATVPPRIQNAFQKYQKIQKIYPELHPYTGPNVTPKYTPYQSSMQSGYSGKPSRENSKIIFFPDPDFIAAGSQQRQLPPKTTSGGTSSSSAVRPQHVDVSSTVQRNGKAQITDWRLLFYGTAVPPQPNDPPRFGKPGQMGPDLDHNSLEFEGERASGQWRETHQVGESHVDVQRTASGAVADHACLSYTPDKKCLECKTDTFLYDGLCYTSCPDGTFVSLDETPKSRHREGPISLRSSTTGATDEGGDYATLEPDKRNIQRGNKSCLPCHASCLRCNGPSEADCTACSASYDLVTLKIYHFCLKHLDSRFIGLSEDEWAAFLLLLISIILILVVWCYVRKRNSRRKEYSSMATDKLSSFPNFPSDSEEDDH